MLVASFQRQWRRIVICAMIHLGKAGLTLHAWFSWSQRMGTLKGMYVMRGKIIRSTWIPPASNGLMCKHRCLFQPSRCFDSYSHVTAALLPQSLAYERWLSFYSASHNRWSISEDECLGILSKPSCRSVFPLISAAPCDNMQNGAEEAPHRVHIFHQTVV